MEAKAKIADFAVIQKKYLHIAKCPRCGRDSMRSEILHNSLSRHADVYICNDCGTDEAIRDFITNDPLPLEDWAIFKKGE